MAVQRDSITVVPPDGETVVVDILEDDVSLGTVHADRDKTRMLTLPLTITARTSFYVPTGSGPYDVSVKLGDAEIAGPDSTPVTVSSFPAEIHARIDAAELGGLGGGSGGSSAVGVGDHIAWLRSGPKDSATGSFDFTVDQTSSSGMSVAVNDDPLWADPDTGVWGYVTPVVTAEGIYALTFSSESVDGLGTASFSFWDSDGNEVAALHTLGSCAASWAPYGPDDTPPFNGGNHVLLSLVVYLPANTNVSLDPGTLGTTPNLRLMIQKVG